MSQFNITIKGNSNLLANPKKKEERKSRLISVEAALEKCIAELEAQGAQISSATISHEPESFNPFDGLVEFLKHDTPFGRR